MSINLEYPVITGSQIFDSGSPLEALRQFYQAFNLRDLAAVSENWLTDDGAVMSNPLGGVKKGWPQIEAVYDKLFHGPTRVYVEFYAYTIVEGNGMFCASGRERGFFRIKHRQCPLAIRTSRVYLNTENGWRQVHHHGSIEDPTLLDNYQKSVKAA